MAENRIWRNQIDGRVKLTDNERRELAEIGAKLGKAALKEIATIAQPDTILSWNRKCATQPVTTSKPPASVGRPRVDSEVEELVLRIARENRSWGYERILGSMNHLGYKISDQTVGNILKRHGIALAPERKKTITWREFTQSHLDILLATDFFNSKVWNGFGLMVFYLLKVLHFGLHPIQSVRRVRYQPMQTIQALVNRVLNSIDDWPRWAYLLVQRSRARRAGDRVLSGQIGSEFESADARQMRSQDTRKVVVMAASRPQQIRDGSVRSRVQQSDPFGQVDCQAA